MPWDPDQYLVFADERALPFYHLVAAVAHLRPGRILDIGCGPGALTATLLERWPAADILGIDSSPEMIGLAGAGRSLIGSCSRSRKSPPGSRARGTTSSLPTPVCTGSPITVVFSRNWYSMLTDRGTLVFQVPANHDQPSHRLLLDLCDSEPWRDLLPGAIQVHVRQPDWYAAELAQLDFETTVWQTTYRHRLTGEDPVLDWVKGTTLRPVLDRLDDEQTDAFLREYGARLRRAYPSRDGITVFPFTRTFVVATRR